MNNFKLKGDHIPTITKLLLGCLLVMGLVQVDTPQAFACSCAPPGTPTAEMTNATAVFAGVVTNVEAPTGAIVRSDDPVTVTFEVTQVWKGPRRQTLIVTTVRDSATCGYNFTAGQAYLVYARGETDALTVSLCSRTAPLITALTDLYQLGEGAAPQSAQPTPPRSPLATPTLPATPTPIPTATPVAIMIPGDTQEILTGNNIGFRVVSVNRERVEVVLMVRINGEWREADLAVQNFLLQDGQ